MMLYDGDLIVGGRFRFAGPTVVNNIARWDESASTWHPLGPPSSPGLNGTVRALALYPETDPPTGDLIVGGDFTASTEGDPLNHIAQWNGSSWDHVSGGVEGVTVNALTVYQDELIVGGSFTETGTTTPTYNIARWDGSVWNWLTGLGLNSAVIALTVYDDELIVGGSFTEMMPEDLMQLKYIAGWDGTTWRPLGTETNPGMDALVRALTVFDNPVAERQELIAGGDFYYAGDTSVLRVARWSSSDEVWRALGPDGSGVLGWAMSLCTYDEHLIVGGLFEEVGSIGESIPVFSIASWDGQVEGTSGWDNFAGGLLNYPRGIGLDAGWTYSLVDIGDALMAGGLFNYAGDRPSNCIAMWSTGASDVPVVEGDGTPQSFRIKQNHPNPFHPSTQLVFNLPSAQEVRLDVYTVDGQLVATLLDRRLPAGEHIAVWDGCNTQGKRVAAGAYLYSISAGSWRDAGTMLLVK
jgi:hypothetical protein